MSYYDNDPDEDALRLLFLLTLVSCLLVVILSRIPN